MGMTNTTKHILKTIGCGVAHEFIICTDSSWCVEQQERKIEDKRGKIIGTNTRQIVSRPRTARITEMRAVLSQS